jgi:hypothetical protein
MSRWTSLPVCVLVGALAACQAGPKEDAGATRSDRSSDEGKQPARTGASPRTPAGDESRVEAPAERTPPRPEPIVLEAGTSLSVIVETGVSSGSSRVGDRVIARLAADVRDGGRLAAPEGSELRGRVTAATSGGRVKGKARLAVLFDELVVRGREHPIDAGIDLTAEGAKKRDAALIGGGAGAGAIIGGIAGGKKGAAIGAVVGGGAGGGAVLLTKGNQVQIPAGTRLTLKLKRTARL